MDAGWGGGGGTVITRADSNRGRKMAQGRGSQSNFKPSIYWLRGKTINYAVSITLYMARPGCPLCAGVVTMSQLSAARGRAVTLGREERGHSAA